jgi:hypothetical protein
LVVFNKSFIFPWWFQGTEDILAFHGGREQPDLAYFTYIDRILEVKLQHISLKNNRQLLVDS